jgi:hypothetical protein
MIIIINWGWKERLNNFAGNDCMHLDRQVDVVLPDATTIQVHIFPGKIEREWPPQDHGESVILREEEDVCVWVRYDEMSDTKSEEVVPADVACPRVPRPE